MTFQKSALALALVTATGLLLAQEAERPPRPGDVGRTEEGVRFQLPEVKPVPMRQLEPLQVESFDVHELAEGTQSGRPGDLLLTFQGQGFLLTAKAPRLELAGGEIVFEDVEVNLAGTRLFVLIPRERVPELEGLDFQEVVVRNPGGLEDTKYSRASIEATAADLLRPAADALKARLVYREGEFVREVQDQ